MTDFSTVSKSAEDALKWFEGHKETTLKQLGDLVRIPSVSAWPSHFKHCHESAKAVAELAKEAGLENIELLEGDDETLAGPYVYADWLHAGEDKPTLLLYAHHDVQPPGEEGRWETPPFEPVEKDGVNGRRLFGRGACDDKAGIMVHLKGIQAYMSTVGSLPVNVKCLFEGEEEVGSSHLAAALEKYKSKLFADVIVLTDTANYDTGVGTLTYSLRGLVGCDIRVRTVDHSVHSGLFGGPVMDPALALSRLLATLHDNEGRIIVPGFNEGIRTPEPWEVEKIAKLAYTEEKLREESGLLPGVPVAGEPGTGFLERIWLTPSITVTAFEASTIAESANKVLPWAKARISCRVVAHQNPKKVLQALKDHFKAQAAIVGFGCEVDVTVGLGDDDAPGWVCVPSGAAFDAAEAALSAGYGGKTAFIGCGGSIPFVGPFSEAFGGSPALLLGVEDPHTRAHGENESCHIEDLYKSCRSEIHVFDKFGRLTAAEARGKPETKPN